MSKSEDMHGVYLKILRVHSSSAKFTHTIINVVQKHFNNKSSSNKKIGS